MTSKPKSAAILYGSTTGDTEQIALQLDGLLRERGVSTQVYDLALETLPPAAPPADLFLLGASTWYYGEIQSDWGIFLPKLAHWAPWKGQAVALFGCGDQEDYPDYFCDAVGILYRALQPYRPRWLGQISNSGYRFRSSKAELPGAVLAGLLLDEMREAEKTPDRLRCWAEQILKDWCAPACVPSDLPSV